GPGPFIVGTLGVRARQQDDVVVAEVFRIGTQAHLRDEGLPAEAIAEELDPADLEGGRPADSAHEGIAQEPLGAGPVGPTGFALSCVTCSELVHGQAVGSPTRRETGGPDELTAPLDPFLPLGLSGAVSSSGPPVSRRV